MNEYGKQVKKQMDTYIDNPDSIDKEISDIQNATHGVEVRGALAAGVKKSFDKSVEARDITENLLDGSYDQGLLNTEIENRMDNLYNTKGQAMDELHDAKETELDNLKQEYADKATTLETTYAPRLTSIETEIEDARGGETNLGDRLNDFSSQLAHETQQREHNIQALQNEKASKTEVQSGLNTKRDKSVSIGLNDLTQEALNAIEGGEGTEFSIESEPRDYSVSPIKLDTSLQRMFIKNMTWESGGINATTGEKTSDKAMVRTVERFNVSVGDKIIMTDPDYAFRPYFYNEDGAYLFRPDGNFSEYTIEENYSVVIVILKPGFSDTDLSDQVDEIGGKLGIYIMPHRSLRATEKDVIQLNEKVGESYPLLEKAFKVNVDWESGGRQSANGNKMSDKAMVRSVQLHRVSRGDKIVITDPEFHFKLYYWDMNESYLYSPNWMTDEYTFDDDYFVGITIGKIGFSQLDLSDMVDEVGSKLTFIKSPQKTISELENQINQILESGIPEIERQPKIITEIYKNTNDFITPFTGKGNLDNLYGLWDEFMEYHPTLTKITLGYDPAGLPIYMYENNPIPPRRFVTSHPNVKLPKVIYLGGVHGNEITPMYMDYRFFKDMFDNWKTNPVLKYLLFNVHFMIVPIQCPWGYDNLSRTNYNGVNINRNYPTDWQLSEEGSNYSGPTPLSEPETNIILDLLTENKDAVIVIDSHNTQNVDGANMLGYNAITRGKLFFNDLVASVSRMMDGYVRDVYPLIKEENPNNAFDTSNMFGLMQGRNPGGLESHFHTIGVNGVLSEKADSFGYENSYGEEELQDIAVNMVGNLIYSAVVNADALNS